MFQQFKVENYEQAWQDLIDGLPIDVHEYFRYHKRRYAELFATMAGCLQDRNRPDILEVGVSGFLPLYKQFFPDISLTTIDRPVELNGMTEQYCLEVGHADRHYSLDLNREYPGPSWGKPPLGKFDYVICTEVLEHLVVNPVEFLASLISLLKNDGYLYLTTPNFFRLDQLQKMARRENPQAAFPRRGQNADAHHHFREYEMRELLRFVEEAGGQIYKSWFADCWENEIQRRMVARHPEQRSNVALLAQLNGKGARGPAVVDTGIDVDEDLLASISTQENLAGGASTAGLELELAQRDAEIERLRDVIRGYEQGRFMRLMRWWAQVRGQA